MQVKMFQSVRPGAKPNRNSEGKEASARLRQIKKRNKRLAAKLSRKD